MGVNIKVLKQNVLEEAYKQLIENYPSFSQFIAKYTIDDVSDDGSYAIGGFSLVVSGRKLTIPIIYRDGNIDAVSYIGDDDTGRYYGLTKTMYNKIINSISNALGTAITEDDISKNKEDYSVDRGVIGSLFATPTTFSPKIASLMSKNNSNITFDSIVNGFRISKIKKLNIIKEASEKTKDSMLLDLAFADKDFANSLIKVASNNNSMKDLLMSIGVDVKELKNINTYHHLSKVASELNNNPIVYFSMKELKNINAEEKIEAIQKIATDGFYIKNEKIEKVASAKENTDNIINFLKEKLETITTSGIWTVFTKDMQPLTAIVAEKWTRPYRNSELMIIANNGRVINNKEIVGIKKNGGGMNIKDVIHMHLSNIITDHKNFNNLIIANNKEIMYFKDYMLSEPVTIGNRIVVDIESFNNYKQIIITPDNEISRIFINNNIIYVPKSEAFFVKINKEVRLSDFKDIENMFISKTASVTYRGTNKFNYKDSYLNEKQLIVKLANEGVDSASIKKIIKEAKQNPDIQTPLVMLSNQNAQMLTQLQSQNITMQQIVALLSQMNEMMKAESQAQQMIQQDPNAQIIQQDPNAQMIQQDPNAQMIQQDPNAQIIQQDPNAQIIQQDPNAQMIQQGQDADVEQQIIQLSQQLGQDPTQLIQQAKAQGISLNDVLLELKNYIAQQMAQQDPNAQMIQQDSNGQQPAIQTDEDGFMPQNIDPEMLNTLKELANKKVLESAIISQLSTLNTPESTIKSYVSQIKDGVNGMVRVLMIIDSNYKKMLDVVSDGVLSSFLNKGKALSKKMTDFVLEIETM